LEINEMNRILMAAAAALVLGAPLAFAANSGLPNPADLTTKHCSYLDQQFSNAKYKTEAAKQVAEEKAEALCRQDKDRDGRANFGSALHPSSVTQATS